MNLKLEKLDNRHALHTVFSHRVKMMGMDTVPKFVEMRNWLWENYGPGLERELVWVMQFHEAVTDTKWAWHTEDRKYYIYLKGDVVTYFSLKWMNT
jgi:hypothetical protein